MITASRGELARGFPVIAALQPVAWRRDGLLCAPRAAPELAHRAMHACPLPLVPKDTMAGLPSPPSAWVAGWYRRSPGHAPAPAGVVELLQPDGEAFGPWDHPTTALCLDAIGHLPAAPAVDVGCGSGLLAQAWARRHREPVLALDIDPRAVDHAQRGIDLAGLGAFVETRAAPLEALGGSELDGRVLLANVPAEAHRALLATIGKAQIAGAVVAGFPATERARLVRAYRELGLRPRAAARVGRWERWTLMPA